VVARETRAAPKATTPIANPPNQIHSAGPAVKRARYGSDTSNTPAINASDVIVKFRIATECKDGHGCCSFLRRIEYKNACVLQHSNSFSYQCRTAP
jgi:hypothetical protein